MKRILLPTAVCLLVGGDFYGRICTKPDGKRRDGKPELRLCGATGAGAYCPNCGYPFYAAEMK